MWLYIGELIGLLFEIVFTILFEWEEGGKGEKKKNSTDT
jgi:hypothetical protein